MGYIKKLKSNELVGGTDKTTIYPVTSTEAVFEEITNGNESSFKSQKTINGDYGDRIKGLENVMPDTVKSITINGGSKTYLPEDGNVELTIYSEGGEDYPGIAEAVQNNSDNIIAIQNEIGTDTTEDTLSGRIKNLENAVGTGGSVDQRISDAVNALNVPAATIADSTGHVSITLGETNGKIDSLAVSTDDIASAADLAALTSGIEGLKGPNVVITSNHLNVSNPQENTIYREQGENTTYKDWSYADGTWYSMATYDIGNLDPQVSYYTCATPAATPAKTATGTDASAYALTLGGHFKVEMDEANTATSGVTLQVGNAAAKELMYNGATVDANNTWEAGEVIAVYYYNNKYWASNAQGGGGKIDATLSRDGYAADAKVVGDNLYEKVDVTYDKTSGIVWEQGKINDSGQNASSTSIVRTRDKIPLFSKHVFTYGSIALYTIYLYDSSERYLGKVTSLTDETEISEEAAYIRIVAGSGNPWIYPSNMTNDGWSFVTQKQEAIIPKLTPLPQQLEDIQEEKEYQKEVETEEIVRTDFKCVYTYQETKVTTTTSYMALALIHLDAGTYTAVRNTRSATGNCCLLLKSSSSSEITPSQTLITDTSSTTSVLTLQDGYYITAVSLETNKPYVSLYQEDSISFQTILSNKTRVDAIEAITTTTNNQTYGNYVSTSSVYGSASYNRFATVRGGKSTNSGILEKVLISVSDNGTMRLFLGKIDQRDALYDVRDRYIDIEVSSGKHWYDISDLGMIVEKDDYLFCYVSYYGDAVLTYFNHSNYTSPTALNLIISKNGALDDKNSIQIDTHVDITFAWTIRYIKSPFAYINEIEELKGQIESQAEIINKAGIVYDNTGAPYTLSVSNGTVIPKSARFRKVVALGNSLTDHPYNAGVNWLTHGYAMAATCKETSWTWQFQRILQNYHNDATVQAFNIYKWEANPLITPSTITSEDTITEHRRNLSDVLTSDVDCVIFRAGENGNPSIANFTTGLCNLVEYIQSKCPSATILMCNMFWHVQSKEDAIASVASRYGLKFIDCGQVGYNREITGGFCWNYDKSEQFMIRVETVGRHTSDEGFLLFANRLASACGLVGIENELHNITITSSVSYQIKSKRGVKGGLISIITSEEKHVVVTDANGNDIPVTIHDITSEHVIAPDFVATFTMPDCDVSVSITNIE